MLGQNMVKARTAFMRAALGMTMLAGVQGFGGRDGFDKSAGLFVGHWRCLLLLVLNDAPPRERGM